MCGVQIFGQVAAVSRGAGDTERPVCSLRTGADTFLAVMGVGVTLVLPALLGTPHTSTAAALHYNLLKLPRVRRLLQWRFFMRLKYAT